MSARLTEEGCARRGPLARVSRVAGSPVARVPSSNSFNRAYPKLWRSPCRLPNCRNSGGWPDDCFCICINTIRDTTLSKSIYHGWRDLPSDIQAKALTDRAIPEDQAVPPPVHLRRQQPATVLLPRTKEWIASLPEPVRPQVLAAQFARIANTICVVWGNPTQCREYFDELFVQRRVGRKGFSVAVLRDLNILHNYYVGMHDAFDRSRRRHT